MSEGRDDSFVADNDTDSDSDYNPELDNVDVDGYHFEELTSSSAEVDGESNDTNGGDSTSSGDNYLNVFRYLVSSGQGQIRVQLDNASGSASRAELARRFGSNNDDDSDDSDISDISEFARRLGERQRQPGYRVPRPAPNPDTSIIESSDLNQWMLRDRGGLHPQRKLVDRSLAHIPGVLALRETGVQSKAQWLTAGQRATISTPYLPDKESPKCLLRANDKLYCGVHDKDGDLFMCASQDATVTIYDTRNGGFKPIKVVRCRDVGWAVLDVDFSHSGNYIIYSSWSENVHIASIQGPEVHEALHLNPNEEYRTALFCIRFSPDDAEILCGANNGDIYLYNRERRERVMKFQGHEDDVGGICFADDTGQLVYSGGEDGLVNVWDRRCLREDNPIPVGQLAGHYDAITFVDSRNDSRHLLTNSKDQSVKLWDIRRFATKDGIEETRKAVSTQEWDYRWHNYAGKYVKRKLPGDCSLMTYFGHSVLRTLIRSRFSPGHTTGYKYIYSGCSLGRVVIYELLTGRIVKVLDEPENARRCPMRRKDVVRDVSWHPHMNHILSTGWDGRILQWGFNYDDPQLYRPYHAQHR